MVIMACCIRSHIISDAALYVSWQNAMPWLLRRWHSPEFLSLFIAGKPMQSHLQMIYALEVERSVGVIDLVIGQTQQ